MANSVERAVEQTMFLQRFLAHHGLRCEPFLREHDYAEHDRVFEERCADMTYHPAWQRVVGDLAAPASTLVFGEPGSGKTALRLQLARQVARHNRDFPDRRVFLIQNDDPVWFIDCFFARAGAKRDADLIHRWKLADHLDAILSLGVTRLVNQILVARHISPLDHEPLDIAALSAPEVRDLLLLAACYDAPTDEPAPRRWQRLRKVLRFRGARAIGPLLLGLAGTVGALAASAPPWLYGAAAVSWLPWLAGTAHRFRRARSIARNLRVLVRKPGFLRSVLRRFQRQQLSEFTMPESRRDTERLGLLQELQAVLRGLGYKSVLVVADNVETAWPLSGNVERAHAFVSTLLDERLLGLPNLGIKLLLPAAMRSHVSEHETPRLPIVSLEWSAANLYDLANARLAACSMGARPTTLCDLFEGAVTESHLIEAFGHLRSPRDVNRFLDRLLQCHTARHTSTMPVWQISAETLAAGLAEQRENS
jgi:hypothetical protein